MRRKYKKIIVPTAIIAIATIVIICLPIVGFSAAIASGKYDVAHSIYDSNSGNASFCAQAQSISQKRNQTAFSALKNGKIGNEEYQAIAQGCCMEHTWKEADCSFPKRCSKCGKTDGEALGHSWIEATCTTAKTCSICGQIDGSPKPIFFTILL